MDFFAPVFTMSKSDPAWRIESGRRLHYAQFVVHECIPEAITAMVKEAVRVLRPGGVLMVCDNDPQ